MKFRYAILISCFSFLMAAEKSSCGEERGELIDDTESESNTEQSESVTQESALLSGLMEYDGEPVDDEALAQAANEKTTTQWGDGCVSGVLLGNVVTYTFDNCTGPWGFVVVAGDFEVTYSLLPDGKVQAVGQGTSLTINDIETDLDATAVRSVNGSKRTSEVTTNWSSTTANGDPTSRVGAYTTTVDVAQRCIETDGTWETKIGALEWTTIYSGFSVCQGFCPADGGSIAWQGKNKTTTISYDGSAVANWEDTAGRSGTIDMPCNAN